MNASVQNHIHILCIYKDITEELSKIYLVLIFKRDKDDNIKTNNIKKTI